MSVLSDQGISQAKHTQQIAIDPFHPSRLQPASYDLALGNVITKAMHESGDLIDPFKDSEVEYFSHYLAQGAKFILRPGEFVLAATQERVSLNNMTVARVEGKSSLGRLGLLIHATAGFIDPGFDGTITLELANLAAAPIVLHPGMRIAQISFMTLESKCLRPYGSRGLNSKYQHQSDPTPSKYYENGVI